MSPPSFGNYFSFSGFLYSITISRFSQETEFTKSVSIFCINVLNSGLSAACAFLQSRRTMGIIWLITDMEDIMENDHIRTILNNIENGTLTASEAYAQLKLAPFEDLGYAKVDHHREVRQGAPGSDLRSLQDQRTDRGHHEQSARPLSGEYLNHEAFPGIRCLPFRAFYAVLR